MSDTDRQPNRLIDETSPYLLQHAHNPVDWYPWGDEALQRAKEEDKPILVSIGYAACHWCHVMERESFEHERIAEFMNEHFVCIKVDREERPDVDNIYMDAVQALTGQGGWPLNMFLTPDTRPFYGGTYFPPQPAHGRPSWAQVLEWIANLYRTDRPKVEQQADNLTGHISGIDNQLIDLKPPAEGVVFAEQDVTAVYDRLVPQFDKVNGGFGGAPKFPGTFNLMVLMRLYYYTGTRPALDHALFSLDNMMYGGIYDQLGGGFARYAVDNAWLVPHFEKMLYDNALLVEALADAYKLTGAPRYKQCINETVDWLLREMTSDDGGFYAALDADSEGEEGKFYVWSLDEVDAALGEEGALFKQAYDVSINGNWEGKNILNRPEPWGPIAEKNGISLAEMEQKMAAAREKLLAKRAERVRPGLDDKIIVSWNALMISGLIRAYEALGDDKLLSVSLKNMAFLLKACWHCEGGESKLYHSFKNGARHPAFLDDYGALIRALIDLYQVTFDTDHLKIAETLLQDVLEKYADADSALFYYTAEDQADILYRKKEVYDSVTPSGNALMADNLMRLYFFTGTDAYGKKAEQMLLSIKQSALKYSGSFGYWATTLLKYAYPVKELAVVGNDFESVAKTLNATFLPDKILMANDTEDAKYPLLENRPATSETLIYLCEQFSCRAPINKLDKLWPMLSVNTRI